ncbi:MAG: methyltransferase [uncultured bacterium]|nr:MAG: methyltransferase [uncultured bacterium]
MNFPEMSRFKKIYVQILKKMEALTSLAIHLTKYTGKSKAPMHPKYLINDIPWFTQLISKNDRLLDIGCGNGNNSFVAAKTAEHVVAIDVSSNDIKIASKLAKTGKITNITFAVRDANKKLPFSSKQFDKVLMFDVLEHLHKRELALGEARRVLKRNGLLLLVTDNPETSWKKFQKSAGLFYYADADHKYEYPRREITKLLKDNGFQITSVEPDTYDTPLKPFIDLVGGFSLAFYVKLSHWRKLMVLRHPHETTGFQIIAVKQ